MMTEECVVDAHELSKSFNGKLAVDKVSLQVRQGEIFGFLGPNGSGKTTTIRMLCGLMTPDSGKGHCLGYDILHESEQIKPLVGYVPQIFSLYKDMTVRENLEFIARVYNERDYISRARQIMYELELTEYKNILSGRLSGGWKQRLSLAAALIHDPKLLLLDEPTAGVDPKARREFWDIITHLTTKGMTALVSTHYMDEAERCNRLAYVVYGKLMAEGSIPDIIRQVELTTWAATGKQLARLAEKMRARKSVEQVVVWGNTLRICGMNADRLKHITEQFPDYTWQQTGTSLEEVFVHLVNVRVEKNEKT